MLSIKDKKLYIGYSEDLRKRFKEHNEGKVDSTKDGRPLERVYVYYEAFKYQIDARRQELLYKTGQGRRILKKRFKSLNNNSVGEVA